MKIEDLDAVVERANLAKRLACAIDRLRFMRQHVLDGQPFDVSTCGNTIDAPTETISSRNNFPGTRFLGPLALMQIAELLENEINIRLTELESL